VDGRTTISNESVCQVARSWVNVGSFHTCLFGVVYVTCGDFHDGSEKGRASVRCTLAENFGYHLVCVCVYIYINKAGKGTYGYNWPV
jgi:hypothetical protein